MARGTGNRSPGPPRTLTRGKRWRAVHHLGGVNKRQDIHSFTVDLCPLLNYYKTQARTYAVVLSTSCHDPDPHLGTVAANIDRGTVQLTSTRCPKTCARHRKAHLVVARLLALNSPQLCLESSARWAFVASGLPPIDLNVIRSHV